MPRLTRAHYIPLRIESLPPPPTLPRHFSAAEVFNSSGGECAHPSIYTLKTSGLHFSARASSTSRKRRFTKFLPPAVSSKACARAYICVHARNHCLYFTVLRERFSDRKREGEREKEWGLEIFNSCARLIIDNFESPAVRSRGCIYPISNSRVSPWRNMRRENYISQRDCTRRSIKLEYVFYEIE